MAEVADDVAAMRAFLREDEARWVTAARKSPTGRKHSDRSRARLSDALFERRRAEKLLDPNLTRVAARRLFLGLTQKRAAERSTLDLTTYRRAERNFDAVSTATHRRVAHGLDCDLSDLR